MLNPIDLYRFGRWCFLRRIPIVPSFVTNVIYLVFHCFLPMSAEIGEGTRFTYGGMGIAVHPRSRIGRDVVVAPQVSIGGRSGHHDVPVVEDGCFLGIGCRILGPITIGAGSIVGANAVVLEDVPPRSVVAGVPARIVRREIDLRKYA